MTLKKTVILCTGLSLGLALAAPFAQAAPPPSIAGTSWTLLGKFKGRASVKCQFGPSVSAPINGVKNLPASISFDDGDVVGDNAGTFTWTDDFFSVKQITGHWEQTGKKLDLEFDHWYDSPMAAFAFALAGVPQGFDFSQGGVNGSVSPLQVTKLKVSGSINRKGTKIKVAESLGFKFDAAASAGGGSNACTFRLKDLGRSYNGVPAS